MALQLRQLRQNKAIFSLLELQRRSKQQEEEKRDARIATSRELSRSGAQRTGLASTLAAGKITSFTAAAGGSGIDPEA